MDSRRPLSDRHLIAEQPGMTILLTGLLLAFFLGYTTKSLLSPNRVAARIEKAASHIHKDVKVTFASAKVSLSNGILPRFAVIISDVKMESSQECLGAPVVTVDELSLPISMWNLLQGKAPVRRVEGNNVHLTLREDPKSCDDDTGLIPVAGTAPLVKPQAVTLSPSESANKYRNDVRGVFVRSLRISSEKHPQYSTELQNFAVKVTSFEPKVIEVTAKSHLLRDTQVGDYLSHANLYLQYKESPEAQVQAHFFGNWREGHYSVIANYNLAERLLAVESDLKHIPLSQILALLQKYELASKNLNGRQVWVSTKARLMGPVDEIRESPLEIRDVKVEGDLGELYVERINVSALEPLRYDPIQVEVRKLDLEKLLFLLNRPRQSGIFAGLGVFAGRAEIISDRRMKLTGEHSGLEFIFSNKGQRELQVLDSVVGDASLDGNDWIFQIKRVAPRGGLFAGDLKVTADRDFKSIDARINIDELLLADPVQKLMTGGGNIGPLTMDSDVHLQEGKVQRLRGQLRVDSMDVEGVNFGKMRAQLDWKGTVVLSTQIQSMKVAPGSPVAGVLKNVTLASWWSPQGLSLNSVNGRLESADFKDFSWKGIQGIAGRTGRLITNGSWDASSQLRGSVTVRDGKIQRRWKIEGSREVPVFVEENNSVKPARK